MIQQMVQMRSQVSRELFLVFHKSRKIQWPSELSSSSHNGLSSVEQFFNMFSSRKLCFDAELQSGKQLLKMSQLWTKDTVSLLIELSIPFKLTSYAASSVVRRIMPSEASTGTRFTDR